VRRLILVFAVMGVAVLLASGAALGITGGWLDDGQCQPNEPTPCDGGTIGQKYREVGALVDRSGAYCSGTLVAGKDGDPVFVTAAHCEEPGPVYVTFDSTYKKERSEFPKGDGVEYRGTLDDDGQWYLRGHDIAVVDFENPEALPNLPLAQLPTLGQLANTAKGDMFTAVGYGATSGSSNDYGKRRYALSTFKSLNETYLSTSQHNGSGGTCYGTQEAQTSSGLPTSSRAPR
jgi:hypothetical protein